MSLPAEIVEADLERADHQQAVIELTAAYALDPMGNGRALPDDVLAGLIGGLRALPTTLIFLAYVDRRPVAIATCFRGFSTFVGKPLVNIHDLAVLAEYRGRGIGRQLLGHIEQKARRLGCGRITLEVQQNNPAARKVYEKNGFAQAVYNDVNGGALFYTKAL